MEINNLTSSFPLPENLNTLKFASNFQYRNYLTQNGNNILNIDNNNFILKQKITVIIIKQKLLLIINNHLYII